MKNYKLILGQNIRKNRKDRQLSQEKLAEISSLHRTYIGSIERGERNICLENMILISNALDIKLSTLLEGIED